MTSGTPPAPAPVVANLILEYLALEGVDHVFGIPGGGLIYMLDAIYQAETPPKFIVCRHETGAAYMADGYARASGGLGVVMVTTGPGATNALTGLMNADAAGSPLLLLSGEIDEQFDGAGYLQEGVDGPLDLDSVFRSACAQSAIISAASNAARLTESALRTARSVPGRGVHLSLPVNVTNQPLLPTQAVPAAPARYRSDPPVASDAAVAYALQKLQAATRPLILLGNGCRAALADAATLAAFTRLVEAGGVAVMTTADGKGVFPESHPLSLRAFGVAGSNWSYRWMKVAPPAPRHDLLLVIGSSLGQLATDKWNPILKPDGPILQVDANPHILARDFPLDRGIAGEAGDFIRRLAALAAGSHWPQAPATARTAAMAQFKASYSPYEDPAAPLTPASPLHPAAVCRVMQETLPATRTMVFLDAGNCVGWGVHYLTAGPGFEVLPSLDMGPMGFAVAAVVGAKIARPGATCVALTGDGAFMMHGSEISTSQAYGIAPIWVVLQDNDLAMVSQGMDFFMGREDPATRRVPNDIAKWKAMFNLGKPDLVRFAEGLGAAARLATSPAELARALSAAVAGAEQGIPQVVIAQVDPGPVPPYYVEVPPPPPPSGSKGGSVHG
jgi:acetolactate synthase-1/2/3 large subunit